MSACTFPSLTLPQLPDLLSAIVSALASLGISIPTPPSIPWPPVSPFCALD